MSTDPSVPPLLTNLLQSQVDCDPQKSDRSGNNGDNSISNFVKTSSQCDNENKSSCGNVSKPLIAISQSNNTPEASPNAFRYRTQYTKEEDDVIRSHVQKYGPRLWKKCKESLGGTRKPKQCRERWMNTLNPAINKSTWTAQEEDALEALHNQYGPKWTLIAKALGTNRTDNCVKNHWNSKHRRISGNKRQLPGTPLCVDVADDCDIMESGGGDEIQKKRVCVKGKSIGDVSGTDECVSLNELNELLLFIEAAGKDKKACEKYCDRECVECEMQTPKEELIGCENGENNSENDGESEDNNLCDCYWFPLSTF